MSDTRSPLIGVYSRKNETMNRDTLPVLEHFEYRFRTYDRDDLRGLKPGDVDALLMPGGWYLFVNEGNLEKHKDIADSLRRFVREGGGYVGICCGQINAVRLGLVPAKLYSMMGMGPVRLEPVEGDHPVLHGVLKRVDRPNRTWDPFIMLRYNGFPMVLEPGATMIASYDLDKELAAIAAAQYGKGRVVAFSTHPEGATCKPGIFKDQDEWPMVYDGIAMGTARMLDNALHWVTGTPLRPLEEPAKPDAAPAAPGKSRPRRTPPRPRRRA